MRCRICGDELNLVLVDLINAPLSNSLITQEDLNKLEVFYPLKVMVCENCWLAQIDEYQRYDEIFSDNYLYYSSFSSTWVNHAREYTDMIVGRLGLDNSSHVMEIASNDGYLLQFFVKKDISCFGVEPSTGTALVAREKGVDSIIDFFGIPLAKTIVTERGRQDLIIGNNVLAHVPNINDFVEALCLVLSDNGTITMEFPHLLNLIQYYHFDTIYHEHFSYLSLKTIQLLFSSHGLTIYDVEELPTHGGSLRIYACHVNNKNFIISNNVANLVSREYENGLFDREIYQSYQLKIDCIKNTFIRFLIDAKQNGEKLAAYGAAAKGNTLLNYCGLKGTDLITFVVDASPYKQGKFLPGSHIPIVNEEIIKTDKPDFIVIFPWNIKEEIIDQLDYIRDWGGKFVVALPELCIF